MQLPRVALCSIVVLVAAQYATIVDAVRAQQTSLLNTALESTGDSSGRDVIKNDVVRGLLNQQISLDLRDATLLEALFAVRDLTGLNVVVGNEVTGTVNASFADTQVNRILDTLLIPRGYSYRVVSGSIAILPLATVGDALPNFETVVIPLHSGQAIELVPVVESLLSPEGRVHSVASSNSLLVMDYAERVTEVRKQIAVLEDAARSHAAASSLDSAAGQVNPGQPASVGAGAGGAMTAAMNEAMVVDVFRPQFVLASELATSVTPLLSSAGRVSALENDDKLIVSDLPLNIQRVKDALDKLDVPRPQVRVWAMIYDCGIEDLEACGVNFSSGVNGSAMDAAAAGPAHAAVMNAVTAPVAGPTNGVLTMSTINRLGSMTSVVQALNTSDDSRLLADPNVVVLNHEQAQIEIVTEVPYQQLTQGIDGGQIGTTEFREAGVTLLVTPHIAGDNTIAMNINPRFSVLTGFTEGDNAPIIDRRETNTTVRVEHLQTLVLGGLRQRTRTVEKSGIPGLSKVPYLGHLFRYNRRTARESELIVFITPEILPAQYMGTQREECIAGQLTCEIESTPTNPVPFGKEVMHAEKKAEAAYLNTIRKAKVYPPAQPQVQHVHRGMNRGMIGGYGQ